METTLTFEREFDELYNEYLSSKVGAELLEIEGISPKNIDIGKMSEAYFTENLTEISIDQNANANESLSANNYIAEITKGHLKLEGYYLIWRYANRRFGLDRANELIKAIWNGDVYFHDASGAAIQLPYSYFGDTTVLVKIDGQKKLLPMRKLFEMFEQDKQELPDREVIDLTAPLSEYKDFNVSLAKKIIDVEIWNGSEWKKVSQVLRHKRHNNLLCINTDDGRITTVTEDHPVVLENGSTIKAAELEVGQKLMLCDEPLPYNPTTSIDKHWAYLLGFIAGDGYKDLDERFHIVQKEGQIRDRIESILDTLNLTGASYTKTVPSDIINWDKESIAAYLAGLYDADGNENSNMMYFRVSNMGLAVQFYELVKILGSQHVAIHPNQYSSRSEDKTSCDIVYVVSFEATREAMSLLSKYSIKLKDRPYREIDTKMRNNIYHEVTKIIPVESQLDFFDFVYDITVEDSLFYSQGLIQHNCFAFSTAILLTEGRPYGQLYSLPPKRADSFVAQVTELCIDASQEFAGAIAPSDLIINYAWFSKKENLDAKRIVNDFQKFVHVMNNKFRSGSQSPFTNISLFDRPNLEKVFGDYRYPDGTQIDIEYIMYIQKLFGEWFSHGDPATGLPYRFPVVTMNISRDEDGNILDKDFLDWVSKVNLEKGCFNIYVNDGHKIASCCRLVNDADRMQFRTDSFGNGGLNIGCYDDKTEVLTNNGWKLFKELIEDDLICTLNPDTKEIEYHLPTAKMQGHYKGEMHHYNHESLDLLVTPNHNMAVVSSKTNKMKLVQSKDLGSGYDLMRNGAIYRKENLNTIQIGKHTFDCNNFMGFLGLYLGDGAVYHDLYEAKKRAYEISFCVYKERKKENIRKVLSSLGIDFNEYKHREDGTKFVFYDKDIYEYLVKLGKTKEKHIPRTIFEQCGPENLQHLLDSLIEADGTNGENGIWYYTSSEHLKNDVVELCSLLGIMTHTFYRKRESTFKDGRNVIGACFEIHLLSGNNITKLSKYRNIEQYDGTIYCVEVPNHILLVRRNGTVSWCGNSHRVVTVNLPRLALKANGDQEVFDKELDRALNIVKDLLVIHREEILERRIEARFLKFFNPLKWFSTKHLFSTIGIIGVYEMNEFMGLDIRSKEGQDFAEHVLLSIEDFAKKASIETKSSFNVEEIPGESTAPKFAKKDRLFFKDQPFELYSNQYIPLISEATMPERIQISGKFMDILSGGGIVHLNIKDQLEDPKVMKDLIEYCVQHGVSHFAVNYGFGICSNGHTSIVGNSKACPICGEKIKEWMTRIIGYFTKITSWNKVRREYEFGKRKFSNLDKEFKK